MLMTKMLIKKPEPVRDKHPWLSQVGVYRLGLVLVVSTVVSTTWLVVLYWQ
jgi:hypothetical protein